MLSYMISSDRFDLWAEGIPLHGADSGGVIGTFPA